MRRGTFGILPAWQPPPAARRPSLPPCLPRIHPPAAAHQCRCPRRRGPTQRWCLRPSEKRPSGEKRGERNASGARVMSEQCAAGPLHRRPCVRACVRLCVCVCMCVWTNQQGGCRPAWRREAAVREKTREETQTRQPHILSLVSLSPSLSPSLSLSLSFLACSFSVLAIGPNRLRLLQGSREADWRSSPSASSHLLASSARLFSALASFDSPAFPIARCSQTRARP